MSKNNIKIDSTIKIAVSEGNEHVTLSFVDGKLVVQDSEHLVAFLTLLNGRDLLTFPKFCVTY